MIPLHPEVLKTSQEVVDEHFKRAHEERKSKDQIKKIQSFYQAPAEEQRVFMLKQTVPSALIDYLPKNVTNSLKAGSADHHARLGPSTSAGRIEVEAIKVYERAKFGMQMVNAISIDLFAIQKLLARARETLDNFVDHPPAVPSKLEDFSVWREAVQQLTSSLSRTLELSDSGVSDALLVAKDKITLHSSDLIRSQSDRRKAWLSASGVSEAVQKEINLLPFQLFAKKDKSATDLMGSSGTARLISYQDNLAKLEFRRPARDVPPRRQSGPFKKHPNKKNFNQRPRDSVQQVSPIPHVDFSPDSDFQRSNQPFRGGRRGRGGPRGGNNNYNARGGRGQPRGRGGHQS